MKPSPSNPCVYYFNIYLVYFQGYLMYVKPSPSKPCVHYEPMPPFFTLDHPWIALMAREGCNFDQMVCILFGNGSNVIIKICNVHLKKITWKSFSRIYLMNWGSEVPFKIKFGCFCWSPDIMITVILRKIWIMILITGLLKN